MNLLQMSLSASVMILVVMAIRFLLLNRLPKKTFLTLWGVVLLRLLIPFSVPSPVSVYSILNMNSVTAYTPGTAFTNVALAPKQAVADVGSVAESVQAVSSSPFQIIWGIGVILCALYFGIAYVKCRKEFKTSLPVQNETTERWLADRKLLRPVEVRQSDQLLAPLTYGILRPVILLPQKTDFQDQKQVQYILMHEYIHIRRFDAVTKILLTASLCLHWFNPLVWVMYFLSNRDLELSCDETVVRIFGGESKSLYARTLIHMEEKKSGFCPLCNHFSKNAIGERIIAIMKFKKISMIQMLGALVLVAGVSAVFATSADANQSKETDMAADDTAADTVITRTYTQDNGDQLIRYERVAAEDGCEDVTEENTILLSLKTDGYEKQTISQFNALLQQSIEQYPSVFGSFGYNEVSKNLSYLKSLTYSTLELAYEGENETLFSMSTGTNKLTADRTYYGVALSYALYWNVIDKNVVSVEERDRTLNEYINIVQSILDGKNKNELESSDIQDIMQAEFDEYSEKLSSENMTVRCVIESLETVTE